jgi:ABC-type sugar transport system substrate-binding protein
LRLAEQERAAGAEALLIAADGNEDTAKGLEALSKSIPIVALESGTGDKIPVIGADDEALGAALYAHIAQNSPYADGKILIIESGTRRESVQERIGGFLSAADVKANVSAKNIESIDPSSEKRISSIIQAEKADIVVIFDVETMSAAAGIAESDVEIYGVGSGTKAIYSLDQGSTKALCWTDEFSMGYIAMMRIAKDLGYDVEDYPDEIKNRIITRNNLFDRDIERLLFSSN